MIKEVCRGDNRKPYWEELNDTKKIEKLGSLVESLNRQVEQLRLNVIDLNNHSHNTRNNELMIPFKGNFSDYPMYTNSNILNKERK